MENLNAQYFRFRVEGENKTYMVPQIVSDQSDVIQFQSNWSKQNIPGSTAPMVAFNYVDAPQLNINLKFNEDMWRELSINESKYGTYNEVVNKFASLIYPSSMYNKIKPPYCRIAYISYAYRGYFSNIRINQYGPLRRKSKDDPYYKTMCELSGTFVVIKKTALVNSDISYGVRLYSDLDDQSLWRSQ